MKLLLSIIVILVSLCGTVHVAVAVEPKYEIALFEYDGVSSNDITSAKFGVFKGILKDKISNLKREVLQGDTDNYVYLDDVYVNFRNEDTFSRPEGIKRWMENQSSVLCLLRGTIISDDNVTYLVKSNFHLGELKGFFPFDVIKITLPVSSSEFGNTRDSHSLVILYALAMDSKRLGREKNHIALFLNAAINKLADIKRRSETLPDDLSYLEKALEQATSELLEGGNGS